VVAATENINCISHVSRCKTWSQYAGQNSKVSFQDHTHDSSQELIARFNVHCGRVNFIDTKVLESLTMNMIVPFHVRGYNGTVNIDYDVNNDPYHWGYALLSGSESSQLEYSIDMAKGFPICHASVAFEGEGYNAHFGWVQIIRYHGTENGAFVDKPPQLAEVDMPYCYWGPCPTFFDAPSTTQKGIIWTADAFLVMSPDALMTQIIQPICGFHWGYTTQNEHPMSLPLTQVNVDAWTQACVILQEQYPHWIFKSNWAHEQV